MNESYKNCAMFVILPPTKKNLLSLLKFVHCGQVIVEIFALWINQQQSCGSVQMVVVWSDYAFFHVYVLFMFICFVYDWNFCLRLCCCILETTLLRKQENEKQFLGEMFLYEYFNFYRKIIYRQFIQFYKFILRQNKTFVFSVPN